MITALTHKWRSQKQNKSLAAKSVTFEAKSFIFSANTEITK